MQEKMITSRNFNFSGTVVSTKDKNTPFLVWDKRDRKDSNRIIRLILS